MNLPFAKTDAEYILQLSDPHLFNQQEQTMYGIHTNQRLEQLISRLIPHFDKKKIKLATVLVTGDLVQNGTETVLNFLYDQIARLTPKHQLWLPGNHDDPGFLATYQHGHQIADLKVAPFDHSLKNGRIIGLSTKDQNSTGGWLDQFNQNFLKETLKKEVKNTLLALHHPPIAVGSAWLDCQNLHNANDLWEILGEINTSLVITHGHTHQYRRSFSHGLEVIGCPATSTEFTPNSDVFSVNVNRYGALLWELTSSAHTQQMRHYLIEFDSY